MGREPGPAPSVESHDWWRRTTIYQVYPRSFADSDGDGIGDIAGIIDRLDHLVDLGVGTLWVSPFFDSPQLDFGYDIRDYRSVAPEYGSVDDAQRLIDEAHRRGLRVLFDLVLNHTSDQHPWFLESRSSRDNPRADWYVWADGSTSRSGRRRPPNNWRSSLQVTKAWQWCDEREQWFLASFLPFQPDLNWRNPDVRGEMFEMIRMWLRRGVDGFRLDIFGSIMHDPQLRDNSRRPNLTAALPSLQTPNRTLNTDDNIAFAGDLRAVCDEVRDEALEGVGGEVDNRLDRDVRNGAGHASGVRDRILLGEVFGAPSVLRRYLREKGREGLHLVFLFDFLEARYGAQRYRQLIERFERDFPEPDQPTYVLENHDRSRSLSRLGGDMRKARVLATLLCTLRGVPVIYQGQEIGMENRYIPLAEAKDPIPAVVARRLPEAINKRLTERLNRDEVRTPMQWTSSPGAGFCPDDVTPWLPVHDNRSTRNVASQAEDSESLLAWYRELLHLRADSPALHMGALRLLEVDSPDILIYERRPSDGSPVLVVANLGDSPRPVPLSPGLEVTAVSGPGLVHGNTLVHLPAHTAAVLGAVG